MPAKSKQQQKFFGVVKAMQKGDIPKKGEAGDVADDMSKKDVDKYAGTKHKGLPKKVKQETMKMSRLKEIIREEFFKALEEAKMTPAKVQKVQRDLVKTIDALKKNIIQNISLLLLDCFGSAAGIGLIISLKKFS